MVRSRGGVQHGGVQKRKGGGRDKPKTAEELDAELESLMAGKKGGEGVLGEAAGTLSKPAGGRKAKTPRPEAADKSTLDADMDVRAPCCVCCCSASVLTLVSPQAWFAEAKAKAD